MSHFEAQRMVESTYSTLFTWISSQVFWFFWIFVLSFSKLFKQFQALLPGICAQLFQFVDTLPYGDIPVCPPFTSLVLNFNVNTLIHRDQDDQEVCLVLVVSDCVGGELCLYEPGIVLDLHPGDLVIFPSKDISHFNLDYKGRRASWVFTSDKHGKSWVDNNNGWRHNLFMRSTLTSFSS